MELEHILLDASKEIEISPYPLYLGNGIWGLAPGTYCGQKVYDQYMKELREGVQKLLTPEHRKALTCAYYIKGNQCSSGKRKWCNPNKCKEWKHYKEK